MARWSESDLEARLCRALDIAKTTVDYFAVDGYTDDVSPEYSFGPEKAVAEAAMLAYAASACGQRANVTRRVDELARLLILHARSERVLVNIAVHPTLVVKFAVPHVLLSRLGYCDASFDDFLRSCVSAQARNGRDRSPCASVERSWIWSLWNGQAAPRSELLESVLNWPVDILGGLREDSYAFTHLIFYCTDFGSQSCRLPRARTIILGEARSLLARYLDAEDYDLAGEILMAWPLLAAPWSPAAAFGFRILASVEDEAGVLPCGNIDVGRLTRLEGDERARYALGTAYHTAFVMGFLCAASLRPGRVPPDRIVGSQFDEACLGRLLPYVDHDQGHWQSEFSRLAGGEQRALTPFILDIAIIQRHRKHDYEGVKELLWIASECGIADSPLCDQASELLERIALCSYAISKTAAPVTSNGPDGVPLERVSGSTTYTYLSGLK